MGCTLGNIDILYLLLYNVTYSGGRFVTIHQLCRGPMRRCQQLYLRRCHTSITHSDELLVCIYKAFLLPASLLRLYFSLSVLFPIRLLRHAKKKHSFGACSRHKHATIRLCCADGGSSDDQQRETKLCRFPPQVQLLSWWPFSGCCHATSVPFNVPYQPPPTVVFVFGSLSVISSKISYEQHSFRIV